MSEGLIHGLLLDGQGGAKSLSWSEIKNWNPSKGELWLHMDYSVYHVKEWLFHESHLDISVAETLLSNESRPRFSMLDPGVLMAWRGVNLNPTADPEDMVAIRLWREEGRLISTLRRDLMAVNEVVHALERGRGPETIGELLIEIADKMVWKIGDVVNDFDDHMSDLEGKVIEEGRMALRLELSAIRRQIIYLRRYIGPQKEALMRFSIEKLPWLSQNDRILLREVVDRITRTLEELEMLRERAAVSQEELQNRISEELNSRMYVLSVITAIFLPLGFLTGLLGINVGGIPGSDNPEAFRYFVIGLVVLIISQLALFKWRKWF
ncbi:zinc transporter ZntB [Thiomicrorhabdus sp.]|uniref:zinc transporter ZntB n=1 Tax=Thiomicrorhabdus sp. TaxID=2039724 RepID=UPI002AA626B6|nr:zinc transporter ZntB [Thiomicrorhabdus sp.]